MGRATLQSDKTLSSVFVRQGWLTLIEFIKEVTDFEWFKRLQQQREALERDPEMLAKIADTDSKKARFEEQKTNIDDFLAEASADLKLAAWVTKKLSIFEYILRTALSYSFFKQKF